MAKAVLIKTKRLIIEPFSKKHLTKTYVGWLNNPRVVKYSEQRHKKHTLKSCEAYFSSFNKSPNYFWAISKNEKVPKHIGNISAHIDKYNKTADIGILIGDTNEWGKGYGTEAIWTVMNYLFNKAKIEKITMGALATNEAMVGIMKKIKMKIDNSFNKQRLWEGQRVNIIFGTICKIDYGSKKY